jgi:hypothetical protein
MKGRILDPQVKVYSSMDDNTVSMATLKEGNEVEFGGVKRKAGRFWRSVSLDNGQQGYIAAEAGIYPIRKGALMQDKVEVHSEGSADSPVTQQLAGNVKILILQVIKGEGDGWVRIRDENGNEGYISGSTRIKLIQEKTKAMGRKNVVTGLMWLIAGLVIAFSGSSAFSGGSFSLLGYAAIAFGVIMLVIGARQYFTAPA